MSCCAQPRRLAGDGRPDQPWKRLACGPACFGCFVRSLFVHSFIHCLTCSFVHSSAPATPATGRGQARHPPACLPACLLWPKLLSWPHCKTRPDRARARARESERERERAQSKQRAPPYSQARSFVWRWRCRSLSFSKQYHCYMYINACRCPLR